MEKNAAKDPWSLDFPSVRLRLRCKKVRTESPALLSPPPAPAYRTKAFFSRAVQGKCFTSYIILYSAARRAAPIYHSPPENATRSRVPRLNAPNGYTPPTLISPCLRPHPRRGRRPRRPASAHHRIPAHFRLSLRKGRRPRRPASAIFCFRFSASGGHISFNSERNVEKNAAKNRRFLDFPFVQL